ncbi:MAG TPA: MFS transporter [Pseudonocardiaceae bacterium]|nr:MFS transporter [Pseudonocardiaceae bacterium]
MAETERATEGRAETGHPAQGRGTSHTEADRAAKYRDVFANGEFRSIWLAELVSSAGDQVARIALSVLVFDRTRSATLAALTFALTFLPALFGPVLGGLADRYRRREVMVAAEAAQAVLMGLMAIKGMPLVVLFVLLVLVTVCDAPSNAARGALLADVLSGDLLTVGQGLRSMAGQVAQVGGFAVGGFLTALFGPNGSLAVDAASFAVAAVLLMAGVRPRPAPNEAGSRTSLWASTTAGARMVFAHRELRILILLVWMIGLPVAAEGLAVPYAATVDPGPINAGWLLTATPLGAVVGGLVLTKLRPAIRLRVMAPLAAASGLPLLACVWQPNLPLSCVLFGLSGAAAAYMVVAPPAFIQRTPTETRGQAIGLMSSGAIAAQGICLAIGGAIAGRLGPAGALGVAGAATVVVGIVMSVVWLRFSRAG